MTDLEDKAKKIADAIIAEDGAAYEKAKREADLSNMSRGEAIKLIERVHKFVNEYDLKRGNGSGRRR